ncbi:MAG TPA: N-acetyl-gamma-glutamyl-phosphate reductase [Luteibaculaceae bacterium]|nr:N-acetyl-gamma-glutamyl-phosphate reductase [Luteibaculaceae bacterium]
MKNNISVAIYGAAGYTGGELIRLLLRHPAVHTLQALSESQAGKAVAEVHKDLLGETDLVFQHGLEDAPLDVLFLCSGHGKSEQALEKLCPGSQVLVIDVGNDFRLAAGSIFNERTFVYGLPELNRSAIQTAKSIANPGCFATAIQLALLPLKQRGLLAGEIHVQGTTGSTGAGQSPTSTTHFSWRNNNLSTYKTLSHQHNEEIQEHLNLTDDQLIFIPQRGAHTRGILITATIDFNGSHLEANELYSNFYAKEPFVWISPTDIDLKQVINTNKCLLHTQVGRGKLVVTSILDNLLKGASGQAVQNMNIAFQLPENTGLQLKPLAY